MSWLTHPSGKIAVWIPDPVVQEPTPMVEKKKKKANK